LIVWVFLVQRAFSWNTLFNNPTFIIGHRGDAFYMPEHSYGSYTMGIQLGADYVEADLVMSLDGVPICSHNAYMSLTTNVADVANFSSRRRTQTIDDMPPINDWWYEDFTLQELKTLRLKQAVQNISLRNNAFDGLFEILTFQEHLAIVQNYSIALNKTLQIIPEIKHSTHYAEFNVRQGRNYSYFEDTVISILELYGYPCKDHAYWLRNGPMFIQSFEVDNLMYLDSKCQYPLLQLLDETSDQVTPAGLVTIASYAEAVGISKEYIKAHTNFTLEAHSVGLLVMIYTLRNAKEDPTVITDFGGDVQAEYIYYYTNGVDYIFSEKVDEGIASRQRYVTQQQQSAPASNGWMPWQVATVAMASIPLESTTTTTY